MSEMNPQKRKVVILAAAVACMSSGPMLLKGHPALTWVWLGVMVGVLVFAGVEMAKAKRQKPEAERQNDE